MGLFYNPYESYQRPCGTIQLKTAFPRTYRLHFVPIRKDPGLNTNFNLFISLSWGFIIILLNSGQAETSVRLKCMEFAKVF